MNRIVEYPAIFTPWDEGEEGYTVEFPDLSGCVTEGNSEEDAIRMAKDAAGGWLLLELEDGNNLPKASNKNEILSKIFSDPEYEDSFVNMITIDLDKI